MGLNHSPRIAKDGLILHLDAANPKCFTPGETTCNNLITGGLVTGANGTPLGGTHTPNPAYFPSHSSNHGGVFDFTGGRGMNCEEDLGAHNEMSLIIWFYKPTSIQEYFTDARNDGGQWFLANYTSDNINYTERLRYNFTTSYTAGASDFLNRWHCMVVVGDSSRSYLYLDGREIPNQTKFKNTYTSTSTIVRTLGKNFRIGTRYTTIVPWTGLMGPIMAYNRALTSDEVYAFFNATRSRFGI